MTTNNSDNKHGDHAASDEAPNRVSRPFTRTTGFVFQSIGFVLALSTCCIWPASHWWQSYILGPNNEINTAPMAAAAPFQVWAMVGVAVSFLGGMLLIVIGLGLQHDRMRTGRAAMLVTGIGALFFLAYLGACIWQFPEAPRIIIATLMAIVWTAAFILAGVSADELRKHPPTPSELGWTSIDEDDLRTISSHRSRDKTNP